MKKQRKRCWERASPNRTGDLLRFPTVTSRKKIIILIPMQILHVFQTFLHHLKSELSIPLVVLARVHCTWLLQLVRNIMTRLLQSGTNSIYTLCIPFIHNVVLIGIFDGRKIDLIFVFSTISIVWFCCV
jgi:hypothetical protein